MAGWWPTRSMTGGNQAGSLAFTYTSATQTNQPIKQTTKSFTYRHFQQKSTIIKPTYATLTNFAKKEKQPRKQPNSASGFRPWTRPPILAKQTKSSWFDERSVIEYTSVLAVKTPSVQWENNRINFLNSDAAGCEGRLESS